MRQTLLIAYNSKLKSLVDFQCKCIWKEYESFQPYFVEFEKPLFLKNQKHQMPAPFVLLCKLNTEYISKQMYT